MEEATWVSTFTIIIIIEAFCIGVGHVVPMPSFVQPGFDHRFTGLGLNSFLCSLVLCKLTFSQN